jgi:predicted transcriptional regulator
MTLREVLHAHIPTLDERSTIRDAIDKMDVYQFPALVVVDGGMRPVAVLTEGDVCRAAQAQGSLASLAEQPAIAFASHQPTVASADMEIADALHLMLMSGLTVLPVIEDAVLSGIVLRVDLMQAILLDMRPGPVAGANE